MLTAFKELYNYRELMGIWALREIRARYTQSFLGFAWALFQPAMMTITFILMAYILRIPSDGIPYPIFVFVAQLAWSFFSRGLSGAIPSLTHNMSLVTKVYVPRATFPLASIAAYFVDFLCASVILIVMMAVYRIPLNPAMPFIIVLLVIQILLMAGLSLFGSALNVFSRDVGQLIPLFLQVATYLCPVIYPVSQVPERFRALYMLNPMAVIIDGYRLIIFQGKLPATQDVLIATGVSLAVFVIGFTVFHRLENQFADVV